MAPLGPRSPVSRREWAGLGLICFCRPCFVGRGAALTAGLVYGLALVPFTLLVLIVFRRQAGAAVRAGAYTYPSLEPVPVLDAAGNPAANWLDFRP